MKCIRIVIHGKVQGVFYRQYCVAEALRLRIIGYVKNLPDGTVEIIAQGDNNALQQLCEWCKIGSPRSKVDRIETFDLQLEKLDGFRIIKE